MSLFRSETLSVALCPEGVGVILRGRKDDIRHELSTVPCVGDHGLSDWAPAVASLRNWLEAESLRRVRVRMTLSNRFVRYALVPWHGVVLKTSEEQAWVRLQFESLYGEMQGWRVACGRGSYGGAKVACAIPEELAIQLHSLRAARRMRGGSIIPYFVCCWNRWNPKVQKEQLFGVAESDRLVLACYGSKGWTSLRTLATAPTSQHVLSLVSRERVLLGTDDKFGTRVHIPGHVDVQSDTASDQDLVEWLGIEPTGDSAALAMAELLAAA